MTLRSICHSPARRGGFTLIEVMISMALVLGLILGINAVFKMAADTVGTGQALSAKMRDARAAQSVIYNEAAHMVTSGSEFRFLIIDARTQFAFRDVRDRENDHDYDPVNDNTPAVQDGHVRTIDIDGNNTDGDPAIPGEFICPAAVNDRAHRVDTLSFFAKDLYHRQTGNNNVYVDNMASQDAWITYGHGRVFDQTGDANLDDDKNHYPALAAPATPSNPPNPKNFYATDWCLLRTAMLVTAPNENVVAGNPLDGIVDNITPPIPPTARQTFWATEAGAGPRLKNLVPLGRSTTANDSTQKIGTTGDLTISSGRYDLLPKGMKIEQRDYNDLRDILEDYIEHTHYFLGGTKAAPPLDDDWFDILPSSASADPSGSGLPGRFRCNPYPTRPMSPGKATLSPILLTNCTQFIVEYAGDYLTQETTPGPTYGDITKVAPDGVIDFFVEQATLAGKTVPVQQVRWYGFPRDVNGDGLILGCSGTTTGNGKNHHALVDVIPLRDVILSFDNKFYEDISTPPKRPNWDMVRFERNVCTNDPNLLTARTTLPPKDVYMNLATGISNITPDARYTCAWGPDDANKPSMIRIIFRVDDPNGRLADGQTSEFVVKLP